ncbi:MAG: DUF2089 domain-containing protein [Tissierellia bacterium]|nr:DUF2089 domain-containing protein [Tissierellia bacterium]
MKQEVIGKCPICGDELYATRLSCNTCNTNIEGEFSLCKFCKLTGEEKQFIEIFIKSRGSIKEIERELGISYPTVKGKLDSLIKSLGYDEKEQTSSISRKEILDMLNRGEITSEEAVKLIQGI